MEGTPDVMLAWKIWGREVGLGPTLTDWRGSSLVKKKTADGDHSRKDPGVGLARGSEMIDFRRVAGRIVYYMGGQIMGTADRWAEVLASRHCGQDKEINRLLHEWGD